MWITEIGNFLINSSVKVARLILISSIIFLLPDPWVSGILSFLFFVVFLLPDSWVYWVSDLGPGFKHHHQAIQNAYGTQILIAFIISLVIVFYDCVSRLCEKWRNRGKKLQIIKATYGTDARSNDVTDKVRTLVKEDRLILKADDDIFLKPGKIDDPGPGIPKTLTIVYKYKIFTVKCKQREQVEIVTVKVTPDTKPGTNN